MKKSTLTVIIMIAFYCMGQSQKSININSGLVVKYEESSGSKSSDLSLKDSKRFRKIILNPILQSSDHINVQDTILLDLFSDRKYKAVIEKISKDVNGSLVLRAKLTGFKYSYCIISTNKGKSLMTLEIPENNEYYKLKYDHQANMHLLLQIDETKKDYLEGAPSVIPPANDQEQDNLKKNYGDGLTDKLKGAIATVSENSSGSSEILNDENSQDIITLLIVYTPAAANWASTNETSINNTISSLMAKAELALDNSNSLLTLDLVHSEQVAYTELNNVTDLYNLQGSTDGFIDNVHTLRNDLNADLVVLLENISYTGGQGYLLMNPAGSPNYSFSLTRIQQASWTYTTIHEIGHNLGCHHHKLQNTQPGPGIFSYSAGWRWTDPDGGNYCSVMTYEGGSYFDDGITHTRVPYFSDPDVSYLDEPTGNSVDGDNSRTIREIKAVVSAYRTGTARTFGNTEVYSLSSTTANRRAQTITFSEAGTIESISIYHNGGTGQVLLGVYTDISGAPGARLGVTAETTISSTAGWQTISLISPVAVASGQKLWLSWVFQNNPGIRYISGTPARAESPALWSGGMPDPFGTSTFANYKYSVYCTYSTVTAGIPVVTTKEMSSITKVSAQSGGNVTSDGGSAVTARGVCWSTSPNPTVDLPTKTTDGTGTGTYTSSVAGLNAGTTYYLRAYAVNSAGTGYGNEIIFRTYNSDAIFDADGNYYNILNIGTQVWMAENLKTTKYNDGTEIPNITGIFDWATLTSGAFCNYNNEVTNADKYGRIYNWYATNTHKLCPAGWHVPSDLEWKTLEMYLGMTPEQANLYNEWRGTDQGSQIKSRTGWNNDGNGTNSSGFAALPAGQRDGYGEFYELGSWAHWHTSNEDGINNFRRSLAYDKDGINRYSTWKICGYSVRCIKDITGTETKTNGITEVYSLSSTTANRRAQIITFTEAGTIQSVSIYHNGGTGQVLLGVYADANGTPGARLEVTPATTINSTAGWQTVPLNDPISVTSGQKVWLAWVFENNPGIRYIAGTPARAQSSALWAGGMSDPFGSSSFTNYKYSVYCTYLPGGAETKTNGITEVYSLSSTTANRRAQTITFTEAGTIQSLSIYHNGGTGNVLLGVYTDAVGAPGARLGVTPVTTINSAAGWQTISLISPVSVTSGQKVWLSWVFENNPGIRYIAGTPARAQSAALWAGGMPDPFGSSTFADYKYSVYCTYVAGGTGPETKTNGITEVYGLSSTTANRRAQTITFTEAGTIQSISIYHNGGSGHVLLGVYSDAGGAPGARLGVTASTVISSSEGWQTIPLINIYSVAPGQKIWLSWVFENNPGIRYIAGTPARAESIATWPGGMPATFGTSSLANYKYSLYCTYTTSSEDEVKSVNETMEVNSVYMDKEEVLIYPNPTEGNLTVTWKNRYSHRLDITIYNILGKAVKEVQTDPDVNEIMLDLEGSNDGVYLFEMRDKKNDMILNRSRIIKR